MESGGEEEQRRRTLSGGGVVSKVIGEVKNVINSVKGRWSGSNPWPENYITATIESQELGKTMIQVGFAMIGIIITSVVKANIVSPAVVNFTLVAYMIAITATGFGILYRKRYKTIASISEQIGIFLVFSTTFTLIANFLPKELLFFVPLCGCFFLVSCLLGIIHRHGTEEDQHTGTMELMEDCPV